jgi:hypothetical protein
VWGVRTRSRDDGVKKRLGQEGRPRDLSVTLSVGTSLCPYGIAYRRGYGSRIPTVVGGCAPNPDDGVEKRLDQEGRARDPLPYPWEPPYVPTVLPTVGAIDYPLAGYSITHIAMPSVQDAVPALHSAFPSIHVLARTAIGSVPYIYIYIYIYI